MICKWCGAEIFNSSTRCLRCGRDIPAMSDCGGFYDLVPGAKRPTVDESGLEFDRQKEKTISSEAIKAESPKKDGSVKTEKVSGRVSSVLHMILSCVGFAVVIILLLCLNSKLNDGIDLGDRDERRDIKINITVENTEADSVVITAADLGDYEGVIANQVCFDKDTHSLNAVRLDIGETQRCIDIGIKNTFDREETCSGTVFTKIDVDESVFGKAMDEAEYEWLYRLDGSTEWISIDKEVFTESEDGAALTFSASNLLEHMGDSKFVEFRVTYKRINSGDESLTIIISGIVVSKQTLQNETL